MRSARCGYRFSYISFFVKDAVCNSCSKAVGIYFLDFILSALRKAPEHLLFSVFDLKLYNTVFELIVSVLLVVVCINSCSAISIIFQNRNPERVVSVFICGGVAVNLLLYDQTL